MFALTLIVGLVGLVGCGDVDDSDQDDETTNFERPEGAKEIISDGLLADFEELGVKIHTGLNPPEVSGTYVFDSTVWTIAPRPENEGTLVCDSQQDWTVENDGTLSIGKEYTDECTGEGTSSGVYLSGEDNCFTTYSRNQEVFEGCERTTLSVSSACVTDEGFTDYISAWVDVEQGDENCASLVEEGRLPPVDGIVVSEETDGLVAKGN